jgi:hypothetical protein
MKILFYCLPLNERYYAQYNVNALRFNGHEVESTMEHGKERYLDFNNPEYIKKFDLIIYMGFSHGNMCGYQGLLEHPGISSGKPFIVLYYDNPLRYMNLLFLLKNRPNAFVGCCDSQHVDTLKGMGFNAIWVPTCYDPTIHKIGPKSDKYDYDFSFAGTVIEKREINNMYHNRNIIELNTLNQMNNDRTKLKFFDYSDYLSNVCNRDMRYKDFGDLCFVNLMTQKFMLRMEMFDVLHKLGQVHIHGQGNWKPEFDNVYHHENLDQHKELPYLYRSAKINYSIELLPASVHQRIMEIGGCGGFALLEDKADNHKCFDHKDLTESIVWRNEEELKDKSKFYLENPGERIRIEQLLNKECSQKHTNIIRMKKMIEDIGL